MLIVAPLVRPAKTLKGLVFIFVGLLIRQVQGAATRGENAPLAMGGDGVSVGGGACPTVLDPSSTRCFSSVGASDLLSAGASQFKSNQTDWIPVQQPFIFSLSLCLNLSLVRTEQDAHAATSPAWPSSRI